MARISKYQQMGEVTTSFFDGLGKRRGLTGLCKFSAANYPQCELVIENDVAMQNGSLVDSLSVAAVGVWARRFVRSDQFFAVCVQAAPKFRRFFEDLESMFVKNNGVGGMLIGTIIGVLVIPGLYYLSPR